MPGFTYLINLGVQNGNAFQQLATSAGSFENSLDRVQGEVGQTTNDLRKMGTTGQSVFGGLRRSVAGWVAQIGIAAFTLSSLSTTAQDEGLRTSIEFAGGAAGAKNLAYVRSEVDRLGLPLKESLEGMKVLSGAMMGTGISAQNQQNIFRGLGEAITTFHLPAEQANRAMLALGQMASKGTVQSEELKGQLGEALPGAFNIAARAMGVTTSELGKMLEKGEVVASDFLPKFASELHKTFAVSATNAANSATANFNRMNTALYDLKIIVGQELMPIALSFIKDFLIPGVDWIGKNKDLIYSVGGALLLWTGLLKTASFWQGAYTTITKLSAAAQLLFAGSLGRSILFSTISTAVTGGLTTAVGALNAAFWANPIMWVVGILATLVIAVKYAWDHFEGFRGFLYSMWSVMKETASIVYDYLIAPLMAFGKTLLGLLTFDVGMIQEGFQDGIMAMRKLIDGPSIRDRLAAAVNDGWNQGVASFKGDLPTAANAAPDSILGNGALPGNGALANTDFGDGSTKDKTTTKKAKKLAEGITGGGGRNVHITINRMVGAETVNTTNMKEGVTVVGDMLLAKLLEVVNSANQSQGGN